jgi:hypothetical protein
MIEIKNIIAVIQVLKSELKTEFVTIWYVCVKSIDDMKIN